MICMVGHPINAADRYFDANLSDGLSPGNALWDAGITSAWADNVAPNTAPPITWLDGSDAFFQTGGTSTVTLSGPVTAASITHSSGTTTLAGTGVLALTNGITLSGGTLTIGSGTSGRLPDGSGITMSPSTALNFGRTDTTSWSGRINGVAAADGMVSKTGTGDLTLTLQGDNAFGTLRTTNTAGLLTLTTATAADQINTMLRSVSGSAMAIISGIWNTPNLGVNSSGNQMRGTLRISDSTLTVANGRYAAGNLSIQSNAVVRVTGDRLGFNNEQTIPSASITLQDGGELDVHSTQYGTFIGGGSATGLTTVFYQQGGIARFGVSNGTNTASRNLAISSTAANSKSAYDLSGGKMLLAGTLSASIPNATGGINNFNFRGGILAANAITTTNFGHSSDPANPVADSTSPGTLVNRGGTLAPGDQGTAGRTTVTGNYQINSGTLAIDLAGTIAATSFQGSSSEHDRVAVSGNVTLGGNLSVSRRNGFNPAPSDSFIILTSGSLAGSFANVAFGNRLECSPSGSFLVSLVGQNVVLSDYLADPAALPQISYAPHPTGVVAGYGVVLSVVAKSNASLTYQWRKNGIAIQGANGPTHAIVEASLVDAGSYDVVITNDSGSIVSAAADLTVVPEGSIDPLVAASPYGDKTVWSYHDSNPIPWSLFKPRDFGSSRLTFDGQGVTPVGRVPAPGVHPRIFFSPDDLPSVRNRIQQTQGGQEAWKNVLSYANWMKRSYNQNADYALPHWYSGFGYKGRIPNLHRFNGVSGEDYYTILSNGQTPASFASTPTFFFKVASAEALRCLIDDDATGGEKLARAVVRTIELEQARRAASDAPTAPGLPPKPSTPRAESSSLGLIYDFIHKFMTPAQRDFVRQELVLLSAWADNYGTFNNAEASRSNWATFSYWVFDLMAIEGEEGFNDLKFLGLYRGWRNYFNYSFFESGAAFEGEGKLPLGFDAMIAFDRVGWKYGLEPLAHHPMVRSYYSKFLPFSTLPTRNNQFAIFDILGSMGAALTTPADLVAAKYLYPNDKLVDFSYRAMVRDDYSNIPSALHFHWNETVVAGIFATSHDPANEPQALNTPLSFFCGKRALMMTRSSWDTNATFLTMHVRGASGGHPYPDRNGMMLAAQGRRWITIPGKDIGGWAMNTVLIDEAQQSHTTPARVVDYVDQPNATFMVGDAKYSWDWVWGNATADKQGNPSTRDDVLASNVDTGATGWSLLNQTFNQFAYDPSALPVFQQTLKFSASWIAKDGILTPYKRMVNTPVLKSFRSAGLVRGPRPYVIVADDIQRDAITARYDWNATLPSDVVMVPPTLSPGLASDVVLTGSASLATNGSIRPGEPALLVRVLDAKGPPSPPSLSTRDAFKHLVIRTDAVSPDFKILIHAFRMGDPLPQTQWNAGKTEVSINFPDQADLVTFTPSASGKTNLVVTRGSSELAAVTRPVAPLIDPESDIHTAEIHQISPRLIELGNQNYNPTTQPGFLAAWNFGETVFDTTLNQNAFAPLPGSIPAAAPIPAASVSLVPGMNGGLAASLATPGISAPISWGSRLANSFTIAFWMKMNVMDNDKVLFDFGGHRTLLLRHRNDSLNLAALNNWYLDGGTASMMTSWTHLTAVFTGTQLHLYRNGQLVSSYAATPANFNLFSNMKLGSLNGAVRSVHFYSTGFTPSAVRDLYLWGKYGGLPVQASLPLSPLDAWRQTHLGTPENLGEAANLFDRDGDGLVNLLEYALGGDPANSTDAPRPQMVPTAGSPQLLRFSFMRLRSDLTYIVEASNNLSQWDPLDTNPGNVGEMVTVETPVTEDHRFLRLRVVKSP